MMTQSVMTQAANLFGNATGSVTSKGKQAGSGFDQIINNNLKSIQNTSGSTTSKTKASVQKTDVSTASKSDDAGSAAKQTGTVQRKTADSAENADSAKMTEVSQPEESSAAQKNGGTTPEEKDEPVIDDQQLSQILGMLQSICEAVMDKLNMSQEELQQLLQNQGMTVTDLLDPANLQKLVLAKNGETSLLAMLTNEDLAGTMGDLQKQVEDIKADSGLPFNLEQIKEILAKAEEMKQQLKETPVLSDISEGLKTSEVKPEKQPETANSVNAKNEEDVDSSANTSSETATATAAKTQVSNDSNSGTQMGNGKKGGKDLKASDQFQNFIDNLVNVSKDTKVEFTGNMVQVTELREIANQIIDRIKISVTPDQSSMELQLNPENLGKVNLTVQSKNGVMTAQFVVQNEISKEAIESQLSTLRETLNQQGIKVEAIEVTVSANAFEQGNSDNSGNQQEAKESSNGRHITIDEALTMTEIPEDELNTQAISDTVGRQIDYTA